MLLSCLLLLLIPLLIAGQVTKDSNGACTSALDCSLLGDCINGVCICDEGFTGPNCELPDLIPASDFNGFDDPNYPVWGGKSIYADGQWHFIASYMQYQCDLASYGTNSAFLRATSNNPLGPFTFQETVLPPFHHGAQIERGADGSYLIFGDGVDMPSSTVHKNCNVFNNGGRRRSLGNGGHKSSPNLYPLGSSPNDMHMVAVADKITGPWTQHIIAQTDMTHMTDWDCNITNLAPVIVDKTHIVMAFRSKPCVNMAQLSANKCGKQCQSIGIMESTNGWEGPFVKRPDQIAVLAGNEDPFMWKSKRGWHLIMHGKTQCGQSQSDTNTCGTMAYSEDSYTWYHSPTPWYTGQVTFDGTGSETSEVLTLRQRPKITFDNYGTPLVLYNGAQRSSKPYIQNVAFAFNTAAMRNYQAPPPCPKQYITTCTINPGSTKNGGKRSQQECGKMGPNKCIWCPNLKACESGSDKRICGSPAPQLYYAHC